MKNLFLLILLILPSFIFCQQAEELYKVVEEMPRFPGCEGTNMAAGEMEECAKTQMLEYIYQNLKYPETARKNEIEGVVVIQFVVEKDGRINDAKIVRDIGGGCGDAALHIVNGMNELVSQDTVVIFDDVTYEEEIRITANSMNWRPGYQKGKAVRVLYTLPVKYKLSGQKEDSVDGDQNEINNADADIEVEDIFKVVEEMPRFPGCVDRECSNQKLLEHVYQNLSYPAEAKKNKIEGMVVIQFTIDEEGSIHDAKVARDIGGGCGEAALKVVNSMKDLARMDTITTFNDKTYEETTKIIKTNLKWRPGYQRGQAVKVLYTLPVQFKLDDDQTDDMVDGRINIKTHKETSKSWTIFPPEYGSYQRYKDQVLIPEQVKIAYQVEPVESSKIVGPIIPFGNTMHPLLKQMGTHNGIDFRAVPGVPVMATADGIVSTLSIDHEKYGQYVKIKHNDQTESLYAHMSAISVVEGQQVKGGEQIGAVGMSGRATYPHLHYEVLVDRQTVDPQLDKLDKINASEPLPQSISLKSETKPLFVIDGVIQDEHFISDHLNSDDIAEIHVLKDEKAIEKYGDIAANGVVEIQLKASAQKKDTKAVDLQFTLEQNYPNPVLDQTTISFYLPSDAPASLLFYNQVGEFVHSINQGLTKGRNEINISSSDLKGSGLIYYFLIQGQLTEVKKMIVVQ